MFRAPRGTQDVLPADQRHWDYVRRVAANVAQQFGYERIDTPLFESTSLFQRGVGRDVPGTGAGLAIVAEVAERYGGRVWVEDRQDGGARFILAF